MFPGGAVTVDNFNGSNQNPIAAPWAAVAGVNVGQRIANAWAPTVSAAANGSYLTSYSGKDIQAYAVIAARWGSPYMAFRQVDPEDDATRTGYELLINGANLILRRRDPGVSTTIGFTAVANAGGSALSIGVDASGNSFDCYYDVGGGWVLGFSAVDANYPQAGALALFGDDNGARIDTLAASFSADSRRRWLRPRA